MVKLTLYFIDELVAANISLWHKLSVNKSSLNNHHNINAKNTLNTQQTEDKYIEFNLAISDFL